MTPVVPAPGDLATAAVLVLVCAGASFAMALNLHRAMLWSATRMVAQLILVGLVLRTVFALASPWLTAAVLATMIGAAALEAGSRQTRRLAGPWHLVVSGGSVALPTLAVSLLALLTALRPEPWHDARHALPLAGMVLGNAMNAASLALNHMTTWAWREGRALDARLALGDTPGVALGELVRQATRAGMIPTLNTMAAAGIVTMPGVMTGQILAGMDPLVSARYQILLMMLLAAGSFGASLAAARLAAARLTDERQRLRLDRLVARAR